MTSDQKAKSRTRCSDSATGSSPLAAYQALAKDRRGGVDRRPQVQGFALDEYIGLPLTHPES